MHPGTRLRVQARSRATVHQSSSPDERISIRYKAEAIRQGQDRFGGRCALRNEAYKIVVRHATFFLSFFLYSNVSDING